MLDSNLYLVALNLDDKRALVVGAGPIGLEKIEGLRATGAAVTVVATEALAEVERLAGAGAIELRRRPYESSDLDGCFLVVAATSDTALNTRVHDDADARGMLVNVADVPELCNFILPAIVRRGPVAVAVSTSGASPALAKRMRREAGEIFGDEYARLAELLDEIRAWAKANLATYEDRRDFFEAIVNGDPDPIELLRKGDEDAVRGLIEDAKGRLG